MLTKILVLAPVILLPIAICYTETEWQEESHLCIQNTFETASYIELWTILGVSLIFFCLFLIQVYQAWHTASIFRSDVCELSTRSEASLNYQMVSYSIHHLAKQATLRNVFVMFCSLFWLVIYDWPLNKDEPLDAEGIVAFIYQSRLVVALDNLTTNIVLYLVFRNWSSILLYPFRSNRSVHLDSKSSLDESGLISLLYDGEKRGYSLGDTTMKVDEDECP